MACEGEDEISKKIAGHVAELIPDGATMQMGIGAIPDAVLGFLGQQEGPGHSQRDVLGRRGSPGGSGRDHQCTQEPASGQDRGRASSSARRRCTTGCTTIPLCEFHRQEYVNDPFVIAQNDKMVAINSAIEVDLTGQVCADSIGPKLFSGVGGQLDFIYGASRSKGGVPIIALPSTATHAGRHRS